MDMEDARFSCMSIVPEEYNGKQECEMGLNVSDIGVPEQPYLTAQIKNSPMYLLKQVEDLICSE